MSAAATPVVLAPVSARIALEAVYEVIAIGELLAKHFAELGDVDNLAYRGLALRLGALGNDSILPVLIDDAESVEDMAVATFGPERVWPEWVQELMKKPAEGEGGAVNGH